MDRRFIVNRSGKDFVLYAGLLDEAHNHGLKSISTTLVQIPNAGNGNVAIVHATVELAQEIPAGVPAADAWRYSKTFTGIGDCDPTNVNRMIVPHMIRMAETRAKARALRDAVNVGMTALEELGDSDDGAESGAQYDSDDHGLEFDGDEEGEGPATPRPLRQQSATPAASATAAPRRGPVVTPSRARGGEPQRVGEILRPSSDPQAGAAPATPKQLETIARMAKAAGKSVLTDGLNRAQASEIISALIGEMDERKAR